MYIFMVKASQILFVVNFVSIEDAQVQNDSIPPEYIIFYVPVSISVPLT